MNANLKRALPVRGLAFAIALVATNGYALAQNRPACASMASPGSLKWNVTYSPGGTWTWVLSQDADGTLQGTGTSVSSGCTTGSTSTLSGTANGDGTFSVASYESTCNSQVTDDTITSTITLSGPGCAKATGTISETYTNDLGETQTGSGTVTLTDGNGVLSTGETTPIFFYYLPSLPADAYFWQEIAPTSYDFQGRAVAESFPNGITADSCNKPGSPIITPHPETTIYPLVTSDDTTGGQLAGDGIMTGYGDDDGLDVSVVDAIRGVAGDTPCAIATQQNMTIDTATGSDQYQVNNIVFEIGFSTYAVQRGPSVSPTRELVTPTTMKVNAVINVITTLLMQTTH